MGMINLSPDNHVAGDWGGAYRYSLSMIKGFSHIHAWQISGILVMPITGAVDLSEGCDGWESPFSHENEVCKPGYHRVRLDRHNIDAELTATMRVGVHRYTFASNADASIVIDLATTLGPCQMGGASLVQTSARTLEGWVINLPTVRKPKPLTIYFAIELDVDCSISQQVGDRAVLSLGKVSDPVEMRVAISYTSIDAAKANRAKEIAGRSFDAIAAEARAEWNLALARIDVEGGTAEQRGRFYTDLFFSLCGRRVVSDVAGTYIDNTTDTPTVRQIPLDDTGRPLYQHHNSDAFWGAQWSITPLWAIAFPKLIHDFCHCFFDMYLNGGLIPRGPAAGNYTFVMTSAQTTPLFACAIHTGLFKPHDIDAVYQALRKNHFPGGLMSKSGYEHHTCIGGGIEDYIERGYIPEDLPKAGFHTNGASQTIEHAYNDHALTQLATTLGKADDAALFTRRSRNWQNVFDRAIGFARPRSRDGSWIEPYNPSDRRGWTECNGWTMTFYAAHDIEGLIACFGSHDAMRQRLREAFELTRDRGFFVPHDHHEQIPLDFGNEPALGACHLFQAAGDHRSTQYWIRQVLDKLKSGNAPTDHYGGDEDQGMMGAWNVLSTIGLFSPDGAAGKPGRYMITAPLFDRVTIHLDPHYFSGKTFTIETTGINPMRVRYIASATLDNVPLASLELTHAQIVAGGVLRLTLED